MLYVHCFSLHASCIFFSFYVNTSYNCVTAFIYVRIIVLSFFSPAYSFFFYAYWNWSPIQAEFFPLILSYSFSWGLIPNICRQNKKKYEKENLQTRHYFEVRFRYWFISLNFIILYTCMVFFSSGDNTNSFFFISQSVISLCIELPVTVFHCLHITVCTAHETSTHTVRSAQYVTIEAWRLPVTWSRIGALVVLLWRAPCRIAMAWQWVPCCGWPDRTVSVEGYLSHIPSTDTLIAYPHTQTNKRPYTNI